MTSTGHERLRSGRDIGRVLAGRRQRAGRCVVLHARCTRPSSQSARVAVIASRRVGIAVRRNRAKRLLREAVRHTPLRGGCDVVLIARAACADSWLTEVHRELRRLCDDLGVLADADHDVAWVGA